MIIGVTGPKGAGKSGALLDAAKSLALAGRRPGGIISASHMKGAARRGYDLVTLPDWSVRALARPDEKAGAPQSPEPPGRTRYRSFLFCDAALECGNAKILDGMAADCLFIDEVGFWELAGGGWSRHLRGLATRVGVTALGLRAEAVAEIGRFFSFRIDRIFDVSLCGKKAVSDEITQSVLRPAR